VYYLICTTFFKKNAKLEENSCKLSKNFTLW